MQILHVIESDGGSADFIYFLAKYLPQCQHKILCGFRAFKAFEKLQSQFEDTFPSNIEIIFWPDAERELRPVQDVKAIFSLIAKLRTVSFDLVHLHSSKAGFLGRVACRFLALKKIIYTTHAVSFLRKDVPEFKINVYRTLEKVASKLGGVAVCCSESERDELLKYGISSIVIVNGTELQKESILNRNQENNLIIATIGRVAIQKNPALFNVIAQYFNKNKSIKFLWMGKGELNHLLTSENIEITGWLDRSILYANLKTVDIYISTASWEGLPLAVLEAMSCAKPLLLSDCVGNIDLIKENKNGILFHTAEEAIRGIEKMINEPELRTRMGEMSLEICKQDFDIRKTAQSYYALYENVIKNAS